MSTLTEAIERRIAEEHGDIVTATETTVTKNNGVVLDAINVREEGTHISPLFYPLRTEEETIDNIVDSWSKVKSKDFAIGDFTNWEDARDRIVPVLVGRKNNDLEGIPHRDFLDLAIEYRYKVGSDASILIKNEHMTLWGKTVDDLDKVAWENRERLVGTSCTHIMAMLAKMMGVEDIPDDDTIPMYVVSNKESNLGASVLADSKAMTEVFDKLGQVPMLIFPSSIHEIIVIPETDDDVSHYASIVREVNSTIVSREEILSDSVYRYDGEQVVQIA